MFWKTLTLFAPKEMILLAIWSLANLLPITTASIIILVRLLLTFWSFYHLVQRNKNQGSYPIFHHITMDRQPKLVIKCKNFITTHCNILNNPYSNSSCPHHLFMHELNHCPFKVVTLMFLVIFGDYQEVIQKPQCFILQHWTSLLQQMQDGGKLCHCICNLGSNRFTTWKTNNFWLFACLESLE